MTSGKSLRFPIGMTLQKVFAVFGQGHAINQYYGAQSGVKALVVCDSNTDQFDIDFDLIMSSCVSKTAGLRQVPKLRSGS